MTEQEALKKMVPPGVVRKSKPWRGGCIQILVTHSCDKSCFGCTQGSNLAAPKWEMTPEQFDQACMSLHGYFGVVGVFGGNPSASKYFAEYCEIIADHFPFEQRGLWCNNPITLEKAKLMAKTFNPGHSNLNVHLDQKAYNLFKQGWPTSMPFGLHQDSRHSPPWVAMKDVDKLPVFDDRHRVVAWMHNTEGNRLHLISDCDINQHWSAGIGVFRGQLRAWFCEIAMAQAIHHQHDPDYPDTGVKIELNGEGKLINGYQYATKIPTHDGANGGVRTNFWWEWPMESFKSQVAKHCHECGVPLRGYGELAMSADGKEQTSQTHAEIYRPKRQGRAVELVTITEDLNCGKIDKSTHYLQNSKV